MKMMKQTQAIFGKYCGKAFSSIASTRVYSGAKHAWKEQDGLVLGAAFMGGFLVQFCIGFYKRREHWYKVDRMQDEFFKRSQAHRAYIEALEEARKPSSS